MSLFYDRDFEDFGGEVRYVFEDYDKGVLISDWMGDECVSQSMQIGLDEVNDFIEYFDVEIVSTYYIDNMKVITGYSKYLDKSLPYKNGFANLQIALSDIALVGYPQLYQGF